MEGSLKSLNNYKRPIQITLLICSMPCSVMSVSMLDSMHRRNTSSSILSTTSSSCGETERHGNHIQLSETCTM